MAMTQLGALLAKRPGRAEDAAEWLRKAIEAGSVVPGTKEMLDRLEDASR
jgi:hypothetical protein